MLVHPSLLSFAQGHNYHSLLRPLPSPTTASSDPDPPLPQPAQTRTLPYHSLLRPSPSPSTAQQGLQTTSAYLDISLELTVLNYALPSPFSPVFGQDRERLISLSSAQVLSLHLPFLLRMHRHLK